MLAGYTIRLSQRSEVAQLPHIEREAAQRFAAYPEDVGASSPVTAATRSLDTLFAAHEDGRLWVAADDAARSVGFALVLELGLFAHLEAMAVLPEHGRRGLGAALLEAACAWAYPRGFSAVTLSAFRDVPWNAPFFAHHGFEIVPTADLPRELLRVVERERADGLRTDRRVILQREL